MQSTERFQEATHVATLGGETIYFTVESFTDVCDKLVGKHGGTPVVKKISQAAAKPEPDPEPEPASEPEPTQPSNPAPAIAAESESASDSEPPESGNSDEDDDDVNANGVSESGKARSTADYNALIEAGFAPAQSLYERGTRVVSLGVENAKRAREEFDAMPLVQEYSNDFIKRIEEENRHTEVVDLNDLRLMKNGDLRLPTGDRLPLDTHAFGQLCRRAGTELGSGVQYLQYCWPNLRARDVNNWLKFYAEREGAEQAEYDVKAKGFSEQRARKLYGKRPSSLTAKLLLRNNELHQSGTECFGLVSEKYADQFHVGTIAEGILRTQGIRNARGTVVYDGRKARFQMLFHTTTKPEHFVAGEFFRVGIQIKTDDTGSGSCQIDAIAFQNLCLNLIVIDRAVTRIANIKHIGDPSALAKRFDEAMDKAQKALSHFITQWDTAVEEDVLVRTAEVTPDYKTELLSAHDGGLPISVVLPGLFNGLLNTRELALVPAGHPKSQKRHDILKSLVDCYDKDDSGAAQSNAPISRARIVNALTRHAHEGQNDPWQEDVFQRAAGNLLTPRVAASKRNPNPLPPPIPYEPFDMRQASA